MNKFCSNSRMSRCKSALRLTCLIVAVFGVLTITGACSMGPLQKRSAGITKGPVLLAVYENRAALMWETGTEWPCKLYYGGDRKLDKYVESVPETNQTDQEAVKNAAFIHKVWLEDLQAGRTYDYRITGPGFEDKIYTFRTVPANTDKVSFIVYGDSRTRPSVHRRLVKQMKKHKFDFVVHCGDLVTKGNKYEQWGPQFFEPLKGLAETVPVYIAKGNHEGDNGNFEKLLIPKGQSNNFGFDYGPVHYFCADNVTKDIKDKVLLDSILTDARASDAKWKFVSYHVPSVNSGGHWSTWGYPDVLEGLAGAGVDFVLAGHSHMYERFRPVAPPDGTGGNYVTYITSGGGGALMHSIKPNSYHVVTKKKHHFCLFNIDGDKLTMDTIGIDGKLIDHLELTKTAGRLNKDYSRTAIPIKEMLAFQKENLERED